MASEGTGTVLVPSSEGTRQVKVPPLELLA